MPIVNISVTGKTTTSVNGVVTDPTMLLQLESLLGKMQKDSMKDAPAPETGTQT